jgi:hypothetical protein
VKAAGAEPEQIVWSVPIDPCEKLITVILTALLSSVHEFPARMAFTSRLNHVSINNAPGVNVSFVSPGITV